jgi:hypothetical protein
MRPLRRLLVLLVVADTLLSSCASIVPVVSQTNVPAVTPTSSPEFRCPAALPAPVNGVSQVLIIDEAPLDCFPTDAVKITTVGLEREILKINVTYLGGCQEHTFGLHGETPFLLSNPPQWVLYLLHDAHGDTCTKNVNRELLFDLTPMDKDRTERQAHPLLLRILEPAGGSFADEPYMPLVEWP